ncbi:FxSxx-COOH cyclophane-containing RiPP peptide [Streptomyces scabiei]|uniref:FxSxx-COOH cyclophane-containing RiPP peptide n=1 Tax=Streptomyces TaxID=1883 RepID=UPI001BFF671B|nr:MULTISPECIES: FxSxx-COOH cyclophane-containing RiPP peptide [unclassified Streptomyces]
MNASLDPTADESHATAAVGPERVSLVQLAARSGGASLSPALTRAMANGTERRGPARVAVAAFQSSV